MRPETATAAPDNLGDYRITSQVEMQATFRQLIDSTTMVTLSGPGGLSYTTLMWQADPHRGIISLSADSDDPRLTALLSTEEVVAVAYLDKIKVQFDIDGAVLVRGKQTALNASYPSSIYRFQRRSYYRVRPLISNAPVAHLRHPGIPDMALALSIADISLGGVALNLPADVPMLPAGVLVSGCTLELDADTQLDVDLMVHHVTVLNSETGLAKLGCEIVDLDGTDERALQHYINQTQKRRNALTGA
jgi:c-di-GMP-binding flagellar brake protein YcgR